MRVPTAQPQRATVRPYLSPLCTLLLLLASGGAALAQRETSAIKHEWVVSIGDYNFGLMEVASLVEEELPDGRIVMPFYTHIYFGHWHTYVEGYTALTVAAGLIAVLALVVGVAWQFTRRHRPPTPPPQEP